MHQVRKALCAEHVSALPTHSRQLAMNQGVRLCFWKSKGSTGGNTKEEKQGACSKPSSPEHLCFLDSGTGFLFSLWFEETLTRPWEGWKLQV